MCHWSRGMQIRSVIESLDVVTSSSLKRAYLNWEIKCVFFQLFIVAQEMYLNHHGNIFVFTCTVQYMYSITQHLDHFYGGFSANKVWHGVLFHPPHPTVSRTHHPWDSFRQLLVLALTGSGISTGNIVTCCACRTAFLYIMYREVRVIGSFVLYRIQTPTTLTLVYWITGEFHILFFQQLYCTWPKGRDYCLRFFPLSNLKFLKMHSLNNC